MVETWRLSRMFVSIAPRLAGCLTPQPRLIHGHYSSQNHDLVSDLPSPRKRNQVVVGVERLLLGLGSTVLSVHGALDMSLRESLPILKE